MSILDISIISFLIYQTAIGVKRGMIRIVFDVIAIIAGIYYGAYYYPIVAAKLGEFINLTPATAKAIGFVCVWILIYLGVMVISSITNFLIRPSFFGTFNRLGGAVCGFVKGSVLLFPFMLIMTYLNINAINYSMVLNFVNNYLV
jgi:uncharacterized membrane protein required for colicin V production